MMPGEHGPEFGKGQAMAPAEQDDTADMDHDIYQLCRANGPVAIGALEHETGGVAIEFPDSCGVSHNPSDIYAGSQRKCDGCVGVQEQGQNPCNADKDYYAYSYCEIVLRNMSQIYIVGTRSFLLFFVYNLEIFCISRYSIG